MAIKHKFQSGISDGADSTVVRPSNWNDSHSVTLDQRSISGGSATINATDEYIECSGSPTLTLPDASNAAVVGRSYYFLSADSGTTTIQTVNSQLINGDSTYQLVNQWQFAKLLSNGTNWRVIGFGVAV